jgi:hypothetical protein
MICKAASPRERQRYHNGHLLLDLKVDNDNPLRATPYTRLSYTHGLSRLSAGRRGDEGVSVVSGS